MRNVKQNAERRPENRGKLASSKWQRLDSNQRPKAYESSALPLSYAAIGLSMIQYSI